MGKKLDSLLAKFPKRLKAVSDNIDFSKLFATSGQKRELTGIEYGQGFRYLGMSPPPAEDFNYIFNLFDRKDLYLWDFFHKVHPLWVPSAQIAVDDFRFTTQDPRKRLVCIGQGITGATEPDISGKAIGAEFMDNTCQWLVDDYYHSRTSTTLDVYPPSVAAVKNTVAVRNAAGGLEGVIASATVVPAMKGMVCPFIGSPPSTDWKLCDGTNGTLDLRGCFLLVANPETNATHSNIYHDVGYGGGTETVSLIGEQNGAHTHTGTIIGGSGTAFGGGATYDLGSIGSSGSGAPHNNMPPFYALRYYCYLPQLATEV